MGHTLVDGGSADIGNSSRFNHVPHGESLDCLILGNATRAVGASDERDVATALLVPPAITSFRGLKHNTKQKPELRTS